MADNIKFFNFLFAFVVGISLGSFVTMASYRLPRSQDIIFKPSYCPHCKNTLIARDLIPLLSWLSTHGKCRYCNASIGLRYPFIELLLGLTFVSIVTLHGVTIDSVFLGLLATQLAILIVTDLEEFIIPDSMQIAVLVTGAASIIYHGIAWGERLISASFGLGIGLCLHYGYLYFRKKDALGWGDVKFLAAAGLWLTLSSFVPFLFLAGVIGTFTGLLWQWGGRGIIFPFGPALACSLFINVLFPDILLRVVL